MQNAYKYTYECRPYCSVTHAAEAPTSALRVPFRNPLVKQLLFAQVKSPVDFDRSNDCTIPPSSALTEPDPDLGCTGEALLMNPEHTRLDILIKR